MYHKECMKIFKETVSQKDCNVIDFAMGTGFMGELVCQSYEKYRYLKGKMRSP